MWRILKIKEASALMRAEVTRVIREDMDCVWVHSKEEVERTPFSDMRDYNPTYLLPYWQF